MCGSAGRAEHASPAMVGEMGARYRVRTLLGYFHDSLSIGRRGLEEESWPSRHQAPWREQARPRGCAGATATGGAWSTTRAGPSPGSGPRSSSSGSSSAASRWFRTRTWWSFWLGAGIAIVGCLMPAFSKAFTTTGLVLGTSPEPRCAPWAPLRDCRTPPLESVGVGEHAASVLDEQQSPATETRQLSRGRGAAAHPLRAGIPRRRAARRRRRDAAPGRRRAARHDLACSRGRTSWSRTRGSARSGGTRWSRRTGRRGSRRRSSTGRTRPACCRSRTGRTTRWRRRAIAARGQRWHKVSEDACERGARPAAERGAADRDPARRREGGRAVVGLVGGEDRRRVAARHRPGGLRAAHRLAARLRPARAGHPGAAARACSRPTPSASPTSSA